MTLPISTCMCHITLRRWVGVHKAQTSTHTLTRDVASIIIASSPPCLCLRDRAHAVTKNTTYRSVCIVCTYTRTQSDFLKSMETEFTQCRSFVGLRKPSFLKTWPRWPPHLEQRISVLYPSESVFSITASGIPS